MGGGLAGERQLQPGKPGVELIDGAAHEHPEIDGDLVVARARGVEPARRGPDQLAEPGLDVHVNVLELAREPEFAALDLGLDLDQAADDFVGVLFRDDAACPPACAAWTFEPRMSSL